MPATVFMVEIRNGFDVSTRSNIFPESNRLGSFTILTSPNSTTISISLLCFTVVCWFVAHTFSQSMSGRFRSPARMTDGVSCSYGIEWREIHVRLLEMCSHLEVCSRMPDRYIAFLCTECIFDQIISQVVFSLSWGLL